ncbi:hypothetical protein [Natrinema salsiterrestre]|uniref:Uncharacterized protein n=1 Tax=Natrinema salsiterrestre TaxID=2950540 RepID=A0A9Q4L282_9EURY|nr:hypothetical protein [Natrinema salsiterrestre]MDF9746841.1 hypothetical protein [Natrinema salsiterrestre]
MNGRVVVGGFVGSAGFAFGWLVLETVGGAVLMAAFAVVLSVLDSILDRYLYGL